MVGTYPTVSIMNFVDVKNSSLTSIQLHDALVGVSPIVTGTHRRVNIRTIAVTTADYDLKD